MKIPEPVRITEAAAQEIQAMMAAKKVPEGYHLRVGMRGGGCGAAGFFLGFDKPQEQDEQYQTNGLTVLIDKRHVMYLLGQVVDFEDRQFERGFFFRKED